MESFWYMPRSTTQYIQFFVVYTNIIQFIPQPFLQKEKNVVIRQERTSRLDRLFPQANTINLILTFDNW